MIGRKKYYLTLSGSQDFYLVNLFSFISWCSRFSRFQSRSDNFFPFFFGKNPVPATIVADLIVNLIPEIGIFTVDYTAGTLFALFVNLAVVGLGITFFTRAVKIVTHIDSILIY